MPELAGTPFEDSIIYMCNFSEKEGAMGLVVNRPMGNVSFDEIADSMGLPSETADQPIIFKGGPVEDNRGFVLHSGDYRHATTLHVEDGVNLSATADIVEAIAEGSGPLQMNFCLGYAGWAPGQLEAELATNSWLVVPADEMILFHLPPEKRYAACLAKVGLTSSQVASFGAVAGAA